MSDTAYAPILLPKPSTPCANPPDADVPLKRQANIFVVLLIAISLLAATASPHATIAAMIWPDHCGGLVIGLISKTIDDNKDRNKPKPHKPSPIRPIVSRACPRLAISIDSNSGDAVTIIPEMSAPRRL